MKATTTTATLNPSEREKNLLAFAEAAFAAKLDALGKNYLEKAAGVPGGSAPSLLRLADYLADRKQWEQAAERYGQAWEKDRKDPLPLYLRGRAVVQAGRKEEGDKLMDLAKRTGCDALHPGYGFLAENPALPRACVDAGIIFIGPPAEAMEAMGSKTAGKQLARRADVPTVPGTSDPIENPEEAQTLARSMGYPVLLKAIAGGGGKGMRVVATEAEFAAAWRDAASEALNAFGDARVFVEKYLIGPRHVEIQIFSDAHGRVVSLGERECSVQRRHQKVVEEAPSPVVTPDLRRKMGDAGFLCTKMNPAYGGGGGNLYHCLVIMEEQTRICFNELAFYLHSDIIAPYIEMYGTDEQRQRFLPRMATGDLVAAIAMTEPSAGSYMAKRIPMRGAPFSSSPRSSIAS